jgi:hypothetical protein
VVLSLVVTLLLSNQVFAFDDPTEGKPFMPWLWEDQFLPTFKNATDTTGLWIFGAGIGATLVAHQYDEEVYQHNAKGKHLIMDKDTASTFALLGSGALGIGIAATQLFVDSPNGLMHARAIAFTSASHLLIALAVQRGRPGERDDYLPFKSSYPSGHTSSAFATATSLGYAYGWKAGLPAFFVATAIGAARVSENAHWTSDVVRGAALGIAWARASHLTKEQKKDPLVWTPIPTSDGMQIVFHKTFP